MFLTVVLVVTGTFVGWEVGRILLRRKLSRQLGYMRAKYEIMCEAANTWRDEAEDLAKRVKEDDSVKG